MTRRLLLGHVFLTVVVLTLVMVPLGLVYAERERDRFKTDVERDATVIGSIYEDVLELGLEPDPRTVRDYRDLTGARVVVVDRAGVSVLDTDAHTDRDFSTRPEIATALLGRRSDGIRRSDTLGEDLLFVAVPVASGGVIHGAVRVTLAVADVEARIHQFWLSLLVSAGVVIVIASLVGLLLARSFSRPILELKEVAARYAEGELTVEPPDRGGPRELRDLSGAMALMADRLNTMIEEQRSFVSDASHQLRTPLTAIRLRLENLQSHLGAADAEELQSVIDESDRLGLLVSDLLRLARAEQAPDVVSVDVVEVATDRVATWAALADENDVTLQFNAPGTPVVARAVPGSVDQILDNLLDNAIRFAPGGSTVDVEIGRGDRRCWIIVRDRGVGMSPQQLQHATRRFWRADRRSGGSGLGLSIVETLVTASGGSLELGATEPHGLTVRVELPLVGPPETGRPSGAGVRVP